MNHGRIKKEGLKVTFLLCLAVLLVMAMSATALADDFSGSEIEKEWELTQNTENWLLPLYEFDQQQKNDARGTKLLRDAGEGDWTIETFIKSSTYSSSGLQAGLCVYADDENYLYFGWDYAGELIQYGVYGGREWRGGTTQVDARHLRIARTGNEYAFSYSEDGVTWETIEKHFTDDSLHLTSGRVGVMNRTTQATELFHSSDMKLNCWAVEYDGFTLNGEKHDIRLDGSNGWAYSKSHGVFVLTAPEAGTAKLLRPQKDGDWVLETRVGYSSTKDALAGLVMYCDEENYLAFGLCGQLKNRIACEVHGQIDGQDTGVLFTAKGNVEDMRGLRILRHTAEGQPDRYYFYTATEGNEYAYSCVGCYEDVNNIFRNGQYGLIGINASTEQALAAQFEYCTETLPDGYTDFFYSKVLDQRWNEEDVQALSVGNGRVTFHGEEAETAYLLRDTLKKDWQITTTLVSLREDSFAGLAVKGEIALEFGQRTDGTLVFRVDGVEQEGGAGEKNLRIIKNEDTYIMQHSADGLAWTEAFHWVDEKQQLNGARYGLAVCGNYCAFRWFSEDYRPAGVISAIANLEVLFPLTGENGINQTQSRWGFGSGDLGSMFEHNGKIYMVYGDTFAGDRITGSWIHNAMAIGTVDDPDDGVKFSQMYLGKNGNGLVVSGQNHTCAMIPSCGFATGDEGNETLYMWVHEIFSWQTGGHRDISGAGWAVSTDGGETWDFDFLVDGNSKFQFVTCWQEGETLYLFGNYGGGYGETYLMRVDKAHALDKSAYRYYAGVDNRGQPVWALTEDEAAIVLNYNEREIGITYNEYLGCYLMTGYDTFNDRMVIHEAQSLYGPWSDAYSLLPNMYTPVALETDRMPHTYGAYTLPGMVKDGGKSMYFTLSEYKPYQVFWMRVDFTKSMN